MKTEITELLNRHPLFETFSPEERASLSERLVIRSFPATGKILTQGSSGTFIGIVLEGTVEVVREFPDGSHQRMRTLGKDEFFGEISMVTSAPHTADVVAAEDSRILMIPAAAYSRYIAANPHALSILAAAISERIAKTVRVNESCIEEKLGFDKAEDPYSIIPRSDMESVKVLVLNCGSSSLKYKYYDTACNSSDFEGIVERIGLDDSRHIYKANGKKITEQARVMTHADAMKEVEKILTSPDKGGPLKSLTALSAVGHRVVHGGERFIGSVVITEEVIEEIRRMSPLAPLHNPVNLMGIEECKKLIPDIPQVAVFDTAFHQKMQPYAFLYGLPYSLYEKHRLRRYGFHGTSHSYVAMKAASYLRRPFHQLNIITCHLGNGASICAIDHGRSVDTSMGLTPVEGLVMGTRCGDVDPGILLYLAREEKLSDKDLDTLINKKSGLLGISEITCDMREVMDAAKKGNRKALLAVQVFCYRIKKYIGAYFASLGGIDVLVFTGGIGQGSVEVRARVCQGLHHMGIIIDEELNRNPIPSNDGIYSVSAEASKVPILVVPTDEERMIARETLRALMFKDVKEVIEKQDKIPVPVVTVGMHVLLSPNDRDLIFGPDYELGPRFKLSQPDEYIAEETVEVIGRKQTIASVPLLIPWSSETAVNVSPREEFILGLDAPVRLSHELEGTPGISLKGPKGMVTLERGVIESRRHIHMTPEDALKLGLKEFDLVKVQVEGEPPVNLDDVVIIINPKASLEMHISDYEAHTLGIGLDSKAYIVEMYERKF